MRAGWHKLLCLDVTVLEPPLMRRGLRVLGGLSCAELQGFTPNPALPSQGGALYPSCTGQVPAHGGEGDGLQARPLILDFISPSPEVLICSVWDQQDQGVYPAGNPPACFPSPWNLHGLGAESWLGAPPTRGLHPLTQNEPPCDALPSASLSLSLQLRCSVCSVQSLQLLWSCPSSLGRGSRCQKCQGPTGEARGAGMEPAPATGAI